MTIYEINYRNRLNEMLDLLIRRYGLENSRSILFARLVEQRMNSANYQNREYLEQVFKGWMK